MRNICEAHFLRYKNDKSEKDNESKTADEMQHFLKGLSFRKYAARSGQLLKRGAQLKVKKSSL